MPINRPFFRDLRQPKKVITPQGEVLGRKTCKCSNEFMGPENQTRCEKCLAKKNKAEMKAKAARAVAIADR